MRFMADNCENLLAIEEDKPCWHIPDWNRESIRCYWDPGRQLLASIRRYQQIGNTHNPLKVVKEDGASLCIVSGQLLPGLIFL